MGLLLTPVTFLNELDPRLKKTRESFAAISILVIALRIDHNSLNKRFLLKSKLVKLLSLE